RTGRRFPRTLTAPIDGRLVHLTADGDVYVAPIVGRWIVRSTLDGAVTRSDDAGVTVEGEAWCIEAAAAYGPDAIGELTLGVNAPMEDLAPSRLDVRLGGRIMIGGARVSAEVLTRAHACGVSGLVAGGAPVAGLRVVYGESLTASGHAGREDRPTVICLIAFGGATRTSSGPERPINEPRARRKSGVRHSLRSSAPSPGGAPSSVRSASSRLSARSAAAAASPSFVRFQRSGGSPSGRPFSDRSS